MPIIIINYYYYYYFTHAALHFVSVKIIIFQVGELRCKREQVNPFKKSSDLGCFNKVTEICKLQNIACFIEPQSYEMALRTLGWTCMYPKVA